MPLLLSAWAVDGVRRTTGGLDAYQARFAWARRGKVYERQREGVEPRKARYALALTATYVNASGVVFLAVCFVVYFFARVKKCPFGRGCAHES